MDAVINHLCSGGAEPDLPHARNPAEGGWERLHQLSVRLQADPADGGTLRRHTHHL